MFREYSESDKVEHKILLASAEITVYITSHIVLTKTSHNVTNTQLGVYYSQNPDVRNTLFHTLNSNHQSSLNDTPLKPTTVVSMYFPGKATRRIIE